MHLCACRGKRATFCALFLYVISLYLLLDFYLDYRWLVPISRPADRQQSYFPRRRCHWSAPKDQAHTPPYCKLLPAKHWRWHVRAEQSSKHPADDFARIRGRYSPTLWQSDKSKPLLLPSPSIELLRDTTDPNISKHPIYLLKSVWVQNPYRRA